MAWYWHRVLILALGCTGEFAAGYPTPVDFDGTLLRWDIDRNDGPILYEVVGEADSILMFSTAVDDAAGLWTGVTTSYFEYARATGTETAQVTIKLEAELSDAPFSAGFAVFDELDSDNNPLHCEITIAAPTSAGYESTRKTILHELGHCLGLGHTLIPEAIMSYELDKNSFGLDLDDQAAISRLYPADGSNPKLPPGCAIPNAQKSGKSSWYLWLMLIWPLAIGILGRAKRSA